MTITLRSGNAPRIIKQNLSTLISAANVDDTADTSVATIAGSAAALASTSTALSSTLVVAASAAPLASTSTAINALESRVTVLESST